MKNNIQILIDHYDGHGKAAKALGITPRHLYGIKTGKSKAGKFLAQAIASLISGIKKDSQHSSNNK